MGQVLGIVYRVIAGDPIKKAGVTRQMADVGARNLIQRFDRALSLNLHLICGDARMPLAQGGAGAAHVLFLDEVYVAGANEKGRVVSLGEGPDHHRAFSAEPGTVGVERNGDHSFLAGEAIDEGTMEPLLAHSVISRIAVGPQEGRKVFTLPASEEPFDDPAGQVAGFSLPVGVAAKAHQR